MIGQGKRSVRPHATLHMVVNKLADQGGIDSIGKEQHSGRGEEGRRKEQEERQVRDARSPRSSLDGIGGGGDKKRNGRPGAQKGQKGFERAGD